MSKTILCIVEEDVTMNYLFIKEKLEPQDKILLIVQVEFNHLVKRYRSLFPKVDIGIISLEKDGDEDLWDVLCRTIRAGLSPDTQYAVNLSSGTRIMSHAMQLASEKLDAQYYFMPLDRNVIIHSQIDDNNDDNDDEVSEIEHKMTIDEYLRVNGVRCSRKKLCRSREYTTHFFEMFTQNLLTSDDRSIMRELRDHRSSYNDFNDISGLRGFIARTLFTPKIKDQLSPTETQYLTGNWFEEYVYHIVKEQINPTDIAVGVDIQREGSENHNDLDVVFIHNNRLYVIECKTGIEDKAHFREIVYKACALKESLLGIRCNAYIFSLKKDNDKKLHHAARNMGIVFCRRENAEQPKLLKNLFLNPKMWLK